KVRAGKGAFGFNAAGEEYEDLLKAGILDPTKVVRTALQNAASVASLLLTTEAMVAEKPEEKSAAPGMPPGGMGGMGGMMWRPSRLSCVASWAPGQTARVPVFAAVS